MDEKKKYELIDQYLSGILNDRDAANVERLLQEDASFAELFEAHQAMQEIFVQDGLQDIGSQLKDIHLDSKFNSKNKKPNRGWLISGIIVTLTIPLLILLFNKTENNAEQELYNPGLIMADSIDEKTMGHQEDESRTKTLKKPSHEEVALTDKNTDQKVVPCEETVAIETTSEKNKTDGNVSHTTVDNEKNTKESPKEKNMPDIVKSSEHDPCENVMIEADIEVNASCKDIPGGSIIIEKQSLTGGTNPYLLFYQGKEYTKTILLKNQKPGKYYFVFEDAMGCKSDTVVVIETKSCNRDFKFAPEWENWEMPIFHDEKGTISIFTKFGVLVYQTQLYKTNHFIWQGHNQDGEDLPMGTYKFVAKYNDGMVAHGTITIIR